MAWLNNNSVMTFGKYKGVKVSEITDWQTIQLIHNSHLNVYFTQDVFERLGIQNTGKIKIKK